MPASKKIRCFNEKGYEYFAQLMLNHDWDFIYKSDDLIDVKFSRFFNNAFPIKEIKTKNNQKKLLFCFSNEIKQERKKIKYLHRDAKFFKSKFLCKKFKTEKKVYNKLVKDKKREFLSSRISSAKDKSKSARDVINSMRNNNKKTKDGYDAIIEITHNGSSIYEPKQICNLFNEFFISVSSTVSTNMNDIVTNDIEKLSSTLHIDSCTHEEIIEAINDIKNVNTKGDDEINLKFIKKFYTFFWIF